MFEYLGDRLNNAIKNAKKQKIRNQWENVGAKMPKLVYWNVDARNNIILDDADNPDITFVSGCSPIIFQSILTGKTGKDIMLEKLLYSGRYDNVK